jgi:hypothetical protein
MLTAPVLYGVQVNPSLVGEGIREARGMLMPLLDIRNLTIEIDTPQGKVKAVDR